jgi:hypothetical protein
MTQITTVKTICDNPDCGEEIDVTQAYIRADNPADPTTPTYDYHVEHVPTPEQIGELVNPPVPTQHVEEPADG